VSDVCALRKYPLDALSSMFQLAKQHPLASMLMQLINLMALLKLV